MGPARRATRAVGGGRAATGRRRSSHVSVRRGGGGSDGAGRGSGCGTRTLLLGALSPRDASVDNGTTGLYRGDPAGRPALLFHRLHRQGPRGPDRPSGVGLIPDLRRRRAPYVRACLPRRRDSLWRQTSPPARGPPVRPSVRAAP